MRSDLSQGALTALFLFFTVNVHRVVLVTPRPNRVSLLQLLRLLVGKAPIVEVLPIIIQDGLFPFAIAAFPGSIHRELELIFHGGHGFLGRLQRLGYEEVRVRFLVPLGVRLVTAQLWIGRITRQVFDYTSFISEELGVPPS